MKTICVSWIGDNDLNYSVINDNIGPIAALMNSKYAQKINEFHLIHDHHRPVELIKYKKLIKRLYPELVIYFHEASLEDPTDYKNIYTNVKKIIYSIETAYKGMDICWHFHTSPGTNQMGSVWLLLASTFYNATLYQSFYDKKNKRSEVKEVEVPFNIEVEYLPDLKKKTEQKLLNDFHSLPEYKLIVHKSPLMQSLLKDASRIAALDIPVLITGESGSGKELFANVIHAASKRATNKICTLNCAAIHESTAEATLFGWSKGAWTGSYGEGAGLFKECENGTLFLDEIGDLSMETQAKLLRAIQFGEIRRVGDGRPYKVNVRIIAATNKNLIELVNSSKFREDLFYRINVGKIDIPPLRSRENDSWLIAITALNSINKEFAALDHDYKYKKFSICAKKFILNNKWPGNIRELYHTIQRACIWTDSSAIDAESLARSVTHFNSLAAETSTYQKQYEISLPVDLDKLLDGIKKTYVEQAVKLSGGNIVKASKMLGYKNYQTLSHYLKKSK